MTNFTEYKRLFNRWQYDCKAASLSFFRLQFDASPHLLYDKSTDRQAQTHALGELVALIKALKHHLLLTLRNAYTGIFHIEVYLFAVFGRTVVAQLNVTALGKLVGIIQKVSKYLHQAHGVYVYKSILFPDGETFDKRQRWVNQYAVSLIYIIE